MFTTSYYISYNADVPDWLAFGIFALAAAPLLMEGANGFLGEGSDRDAVLLPFMDSVNHQGGVESRVELDPFGGVFTLSIEEEGCVVQDGGGGKNQLFISYGDIVDAELLLNYGFLEDVDMNDFGGGSSLNDKEKEPWDAVRKLLAETFVERGPLRKQTGRYVDD